MVQEIRWQYRFRNFSRAFSLLREALDTQIEDLNQLEREGVIQRFEFTFELSWQLLKDRLEYGGVVMNSVNPRNVIRSAAATGLVTDGQTWMNMLEDRRNTSHRYDMELLESTLSNIQNNYLPILETLHRDVAPASFNGNPGISENGLPPAVLRQLLSVFQQYQDLTTVTLFGSYATGKATPRSDIDLVTKGITDRYRIGRLALDLEDLPIPQKCDVQAYETIDYHPLKRHIDERGVTIYEKATSAEAQ